MSKEKSAYIQQKIAEFKTKLQKPITEFKTGGFRPSGERNENWIGRVFLCKPNEKQPVIDKNGKELYALAQFYLPDLPFVPEQLKHVTWLTVFMGKEFPHIEAETATPKIDENGEQYWELSTELGKNGDGWLIREYTTEDELVEYEFPTQEYPKPFPLKPIYKERDFPFWDGGGIPDGIADEISELDNYNDKENENLLNYYDDIMGGEHSYSHKFGGYPSFCQSGIYFGDDFEFVFQISSDEKAQFNVIDSGSLMFARNSKTGEWGLYYDFY